MAHEVCAAEFMGKHGQSQQGTQWFELARLGSPALPTCGQPPALALQANGQVACGRTELRVAAPARLGRRGRAALLQQERAVQDLVACGEGRVRACV